MNKQCLSAYRAGATTMLDEVLQYLPGPQLRALREWVEQDLANAKGGEPPLPPSLWRNEQAGAD